MINGFIRPANFANFHTEPNKLYQMKEQKGKRQKKGHRSSVIARDPSGIVAMTHEIRQTGWVFVNCVRINHIKIVQLKVWGKIYIRTDAFI